MSQNNLKLHMPFLKGGPLDNSKKGDPRLLPHLPHPISTTGLQSEKRQKWIREIRGERLQGIAEGISSAPRLASSSTTWFPGRNECPGTHCSLIEQEEKRQFLPDLPQSLKYEEKWRREQYESQIVEEERRSGRLVGAVETNKERAEWCRLYRKYWNKLGLLKRKEWHQCHRESSWQERRSRPCQKKKKQSRLSRVPDHEMGESQGGREPHFGEREEDQSEIMES